MRIRILLFIFLFPPFILASQGQSTSSSPQTATNEGSKTQQKGKSLLKKLSDKALVGLTDSDNAGVRCSAFLALVKMDSNKVRPVFVKHMDDDEKLTLNFLWGLVTDYERVNQFMLEQLHPDTSESSYKLTKQEYETCKKLIYQ
ncbi:MULTISPECIES: HEAT repeat domain-containing protein [Rufibacter]|uniref:HEAT repeat domain-containing protein n=1 Tax=Rufibacter quisquiliarum TaxID=1549639 RepID=A0A839GPT9_9BACT|nr:MULTISPECIES: HEAT repeat domain-containing protein [Rufibacter]MBA9076458.1 hypothetical protein [Rufibacter quisquiliarum]